MHFNWTHGFPLSHHSIHLHHVRVFERTVPWWLPPGGTWPCPPPLTLPWESSLPPPPHHLVIPTLPCTQYQIAQIQADCQGCSYCVTVVMVQLWSYHPPPPPPLQSREYLHNPANLTRLYRDFYIKGGCEQPLHMQAISIQSSNISREVLRVFQQPPVQLKNSSQHRKLTPLCCTYPAKHNVWGWLYVN